MKTLDRVFILNFLHWPVMQHALNLKNAPNFNYSVLERRREVFMFGYKYNVYKDI